VLGGETKALGNWERRVSPAPVKERPKERRRKARSGTGEGRAHPGKIWGGKEAANDKLDLTGIEQERRENLMHSGGKKKVKERCAQGGEG